MTDASPIAVNLIAALVEELNAGGCSLANDVAAGKELYLVRNDAWSDEILYWSNKEGFTDVGYNFFTQNDVRKFDLPVGGHWVSVPEAIAFDEAYPSRSAPSL